MGWLWGTSSSSNGKTTTDDPLGKLDPSLREFLEKESPVKYTTSNPQTPSPSPPTAKKPQTYTEQILPPPTSPSPASAQTDPSAPKAPAESLFPDGRYAHLWKNYKSKFDVENSNKTDQEKLLDVLEGYKFRKGEIGRAALENCANEQWDVNDCFRNGGWKSRMTMCRAENRKLERCYLMQAVCIAPRPELVRGWRETMRLMEMRGGQKFLKALGYLSTFDRPPEVDEKIQMHADTLFHRMLEQEKVIEAAKAAGQPIPHFPPIIPSRSTAVASASPSSHADTVPADDRITLDKLRPDIQAQLRKRLEGLKPEEKEVEEKAISAEIEAGDRLARQVGTLFEEQAQSKKERREQGKDTLTDKISGLFGW